jgi:F0F1-type ATP synthase assembly protein I
MLVIILAGVFGGIKLDEWLGLSIPVFTVVFSILAVILSIYTVTKDLMKPSRGTDKKSPEKK